MQQEYRFLEFCCSRHSFLNLNALFKLLFMPKSTCCIHFAGTVPVSVVLLTSKVYHPLSGGWNFVKTKAFLKVVYRVTVDYHLSQPPPPSLVHRN